MARGSSLFAFGLVVMATLATALPPLPPLPPLRRPQSPPKISDWCPDPRMKWVKETVQCRESVFGRDPNDVPDPAHLPDPRKKNPPGVLCPLGTLGFTFDIDGVLMRGSTAINGSALAVMALMDLKVPFTLLTNGGGKHELEKISAVNKVLGTNIPENRLVQSHTPFRYFETHKNGTILVIAQDPKKTREVFESYGYKTVVTTCDILAAEPRLWDFLPKSTDPDVTDCARPLPKPINPSDPANSLKIDAIYSINDARWWHWDSQVIQDLMISKDGILGTISEKNGNASLRNNGWGQDGQPKIYFSADDLEFSSRWPVPRFGCGAFNKALFAVWAEKTGGAEFNYMTIGKPTHFQYDFIEKQMMKILGETTEVYCPLGVNYMIGDNPLSDIAGARNYRSNMGTTWRGVLVETGVYQAGTVPSVEPYRIVHDCFEAVRGAMIDHNRGDIFDEAVESIKLRLQG